MKKYFSFLAITAILFAARVHAVSLTIDPKDQPDTKIVYSPHMMDHAQNSLVTDVPADLSVGKHFLPDKTGHFISLIDKPRVLWFRDIVAICGKTDQDRIQQISFPKDPQHAVFQLVSGRIADVSIEGNVACRNP